MLIQSYGPYMFPVPVPEDLGLEAVSAYQDYLSEDAYCRFNGLQPPLDSLQPWDAFVREYIGAELENARDGTSQLQMLPKR